LLSVDGRGFELGPRCFRETLRKTVLPDDEIDLTRRFVVFDGFRCWLGSLFGRLVLGW
jgi:hypothetical protein